MRMRQLTQTMCSAGEQAWPALATQSRKTLQFPSFTHAQSELAAPHPERECPEGSPFYITGRSMTGLTPAALNAPLVFLCLFCFVS